MNLDIPDGWAEPTKEFPARVQVVHRFNRFYSRQIDALHQRMARSGFSTTEDRILHEIAHRPTSTASKLWQELGLNAGHLSRLLTGLEEKGLISRSRSDTDARVVWLQLTEKGHRAVQYSAEASRPGIEALLKRLSDIQQHDLVNAMARIQALLTGTPSAWMLRPPQAGDMGRVIQQHGSSCASEYGWNDEFEATVIDFVAHYIRECDPASDRCWIAEMNGCAIGCAFVVRESGGTARLRLLHVDPCARGIGIGRKLLEEAQRFCRRAGYERIVAASTDEIAKRHRSYALAGFRLVDQSDRIAFGKRMLRQTWSKAL